MALLGEPGQSLGQLVQSFLDDPAYRRAWLTSTVGHHRNLFLNSTWREDTIARVTGEVAKLRSVSPAAQRVIVADRLRNHHGIGPDPRVFYLPVRYGDSRGGGKRYQGEIAGYWLEECAEIPKEAWELLSRRPLPS